MIPRRIVQVWLGPRPVPLRWIRSWARAHPAWDHHVWRERDIDAFGLRNARLFSSLLRAGVYDAASDVARIEILHRLGGVYIDADSECLRALDDAPFLREPFFATQEITPSGGTFTTNAFMGSVAGHPLLERYITDVGRAKIRCVHGEGAAFCCAWRITGPRQLTRLAARFKVCVVEPAVFFTQTITGEPVDGEHFGRHYWSSTTERSPVGEFAGRGYGEAR